MTQSLPPVCMPSLDGPILKPVQAARVRRDWLRLRESVSLPKRIALGAAAWLVFLALWQYLATAVAASPLFPSPQQVLETLWLLFAERGYASDVLASLQRIGISFALACAIGLPLGVLMGAFPAIDSALNPLVAAFRYLPAPAFIPLLLMWLGTGDVQKIALLVLGVLWFLIALVCDTTRQVPRELIEASRTLGANRALALLRVIVPAALPGIVDTCRQMLAVSWTYLVVAEIVAATDGIGASMMRARRFVHVDEIMAGIVVIGVLGLLCDLAFRSLHWLSFPYLRRR
jgi:NitT/TauT family transport system permease protein